MTRKDGQASFVLMLIVYVPKPERHHTTLRRAIEARIQQQLPRVAAFLDGQGVASGSASRNYMTVTQARLPEGSPLQVPDSATFSCSQLTLSNPLSVMVRERSSRYTTLSIALSGSRFKAYRCQSRSTLRI
jgi:hypothetical protein